MGRSVFNSLFYILCPRVDVQQFGFENRLQADFFDTGIGTAFPVVALQTSRLPHHESVRQEQSFPRNLR